jgi:glucose/arabinose dehydrogenase
MKMHYLLTSIIAMLISCGSINRPQKKTDAPLLNTIKLPKGFSISIWSDSVDNARSLALGAKGTVFVGNRQGDKVYALRDNNNDGKADEKFILLSGLHMPNGVAFHNGSLYVAEVSKIWRLDNIEDNLANPPKPVLVFDQLPTDDHHGWKYIAFGPDGKLYVPIGAPCNICNYNEKDERYASITRMNPDGSGFEVYAHGIRNSVGFDWNPETKELWFTENGRDMMGDDVPTDELNNAPKAGMNFGFPYCHQGDILDPKYGKGHSCDEFTKPVAKLGPHVAALGMKFYTGNMFPSEYKNQVFIAEHGSWNRATAIGYRISLVTFKEGKATYTTFADGWLNDNKAWGRPVDILQLPDGSLLVSDDFAGAIYRITYKQ